MDHVPASLNQFTPPAPPRPVRRSAPYPTSPRMPDSPFKPTSSLKHRRQSSTAMSMSPASYGCDVEFRGNGDVEAASRSLGGVMGQGAAGSMDDDDELLGRIGQAMTLLSLHPTNSGASTQFPSTASTHTPAHSPSLAPWPSPKELLEESLRQSFSALHALERIKVLADHYPSGGDEQEEEGRIAQIMGYYDRAVGEMKAAGEVMAWAQHHLSKEKEIARERLLKG